MIAKYVMRITIALVLVGLVLPAGSQARTPRPQTIKPDNAVVPIGYDATRIEVKFQDDLDIYIDASGKVQERSKQALVSVRATTVLNAIETSGGEWSREITLPEAQVDALRATAEANLNREIADLNTFFVLDVPSGVSAVDWMNDLNALDEVEIAHAMPLPVAAPVPGSFVDDQGYLDPATDGINSEYAWTLPGGTGTNVVISDVEYSWNLNHQDLPAVTTRVPGGETANDPFGDNNHGTAVLGELASLNNGFGTTGAVYGATIEVAPANFDSGYKPALAITTAAANLVAGDCILIEQQISGPNAVGGGSQFGLVPLEWWLSVYTAIQVAVGNGIHVIEAAGNGSQDLDDPVYSMGNGGHWPFLPANDSGAIIVGAGAAPAAFSGSDTDRSRLNFSCYGSRVNLQGWGERVMTTGYGSFYNAEGVNLWYRSTFGGTSSASPIVTSAVAAVQSVNEQVNGGGITPANMRTLLMNTGSPQQAGGNPVSENIGPRPNLFDALQTIDNDPPVITCPAPDTVQCNSFGGVYASDASLSAFFAGVSATDTFDPDPTITDDAPTQFPLGTTDVIFTAEDNNNNTAACTTSVTVIDTIPPTLDIVWNRYELWPPNHKMAEIYPTTFDISDVCCDVDWVLESITSNEPDNGRGDGNTVDDIQDADFETEDNEFLLRSERSGKGDGRCYTIIYRAWDCEGNVARDTSCVTVPHDQGGSAKVAFGFTTDGRSFSGDPTFTLVIPSKEAEYEIKGNRETLVSPAVVASELDVSRAYIGNTDGVLRAKSSYLKDVNDDGLTDLVLHYETEKAENIETGHWLSPADGLANAAAPGYLGLHFTGQDGTPYLVSDIFGLGTPITFREDGERDIRDVGDTPALSAGQSPTYDTDLTSVYPNPFNPTTTISFSLAASSNVTIAVYDVRGALVSVLANTTMPGGAHNVEWHGFDDNGRAVASGVYFVRMVVGNFEKTRKMVMLK